MTAGPREKGISTAWIPSANHLFPHSSTATTKYIQSNQNKTYQPSPLIKPNHNTANMSAQDIPTGEVHDNDYQSRTGQNEIPVQTDDKPVEDPIDPETADSDATLGKPTHIAQSISLVTVLTSPTEADEKNAIDQSNIIDERTRGATKSAGTYQEPGDEEGLPGPEDGTSRVAGGPN
jgi:hypothetical protein